MVAPSSAASNPYFQFVSARKEPFGEQVFYWLHWTENDKRHRIQVILDFARAKLITRFFVSAAQSGPPPPPVHLPTLELVCRQDDLTITAKEGSQSRSLTFDRMSYTWMSCALAMSGMAIRGIGGDSATFGELVEHPLYRDLEARSALQEVRDLPAFHVLKDHPAFIDLARRATLCL